MPSHGLSCDTIAAKLPQAKPSQATPTTVDSVDVADESKACLLQVALDSTWRGHESCLTWAMKTQVEMKSNMKLPFQT